MTTLRTRKGKPTNKTLAELVGHVVTIHHLCCLVKVSNCENDYGKVVLAPFEQLITAFLYERTAKPELDHGKLEVSDADPVCAPTVDVEEQTGNQHAEEQFWDLVIEGVHVAGFEADKTQADKVKSELDEALSHLPRVSDVIEEVARWLSGDGHKEFPDCSPKQMARRLRKHFNLPAATGGEKKLDHDQISESLGSIVQPATAEAMRQAMATGKLSQPTPPADADAVEDKAIRVLQASADRFLSEGNDLAAAAMDMAVNELAAARKDGE